MNSRIKQRNIFLALFLSIITCGIYGIYWFYDILDTVYSLDEKTEGSPALDVFLTYITCGLYGYYAWYKISNSLINIRQSKKMNYIDNTALLMILFLFGLHFINLCITQEELTKISNFEEFNNNNNSLTDDINNNDLY